MPWGQWPPSAVWTDWWTAICRLSPSSTERSNQLASQCHLDWLQTLDGSVTSHFGELWDWTSLWKGSRRRSAIHLSRTRFHSRIQRRAWCSRLWSPLSHRVRRPSQRRARGYKSVRASCSLAIRKDLCMLTFCLKWAACRERIRTRAWAVLCLSWSYPCDSRVMSTASSLYRGHQRIQGGSFE